ncbi:MAG TPA: O-antigen ligase family protein [Solirubrobacteraceae bacterium]|nr:O-antigen ligase family protein [Solirubrobacteraceae bacterium]
MAARARPFPPSSGRVALIDPIGGGPAAGPVPARAAANSTGLHRAAFACLAVSIPLSTLNALRLSSSLSFGDPFLVLAGALVGLGYLGRGLPRRAIPTWLPISAAALLLAGLIAAFQGNVEADLLPAVEFAGTLLGLPLVAAVLIDTPRRLERVVEVWLLAASLSALVGAADLAAHLNIGLSLTGLDFVTYTHRATGLTLQPNHLGLVSAMALPVALVRAIRPVGPRGELGPKLRNLGYALALGLGILVSGSRAGLLAVVVALIALPLLQTERHRVGQLFAIPLVVIGLLGVVVLDGSIASSLGVITGSRLTGTAAGTSESNDYRITAYGTALRQFADDPIVGQGFNVARVAHDIYFQLLQAGGIVALAGFGLFVAGAFRAQREIDRRPDRVPGSDLAVALTASLIVWLVNGTLQNELYDRYLYIPVALLLALRQMNRRLPAAPRRQQGGAARAASPGRPARAS